MIEVRSLQPKDSKFLDVSGQPLTTYLHQCTNLHHKPEVSTIIIANAGLVVALYWSHVGTFVLTVRMYQTITCVRYTTLHGTLVVYVLWVSDNKLSLSIITIQHCNSTPAPMIHCNLKHHSAPLAHRTHTTQHYHITCETKV